MYRDTKGRTLCIDYGSKRIGVAVSDPSGIIAQPLEVIENTSEESLIERIKGISQNYAVVKIIIGLPLSLSGEIGSSARKVIDFGNRLQEKIEFAEIETWDERLSTAFAEKEMIRDNVRRRKRKKVIDKLAATLILQSYLDFQGNKGV